MSQTTEDLSTVAIRIPLPGGMSVAADLISPRDAKGVVVFAHGSGSSRRSPRNRYVAGELNARHFATVLADLLTEEEELFDQRGGTLRFDIPALTERLLRVVEWVHGYDLIGTLPIGLFGASTGAAAALDAAAARPALIHAVVSRGGRPDLASSLDGVRAPTLFIVGGDDTRVLDWNRETLEKMTATRELEIVPGATHLFEEPGALEQVATLAGAWFDRYLTKGA